VTLTRLATFGVPLARCCQMEHDRRSVKPLLADLLFGATASVYLAACVLFAAFLLGKAERAYDWAPRLVAIGVPLHAAQIVVS
jgi:hypothetical protein